MPIRKTDGQQRHLDVVRDVELALQHLEIGLGFEGAVQFLDQAAQPLVLILNADRHVLESRGKERKVVLVALIPIDDGQQPATLPRGRALRGRPRIALLFGLSLQRRKVLEHLRLSIAVERSGQLGHLTADEPNLPAALPFARNLQRHEHQHVAPQLVQRCREPQSLGAAAPARRLDAGVALRQPFEAADQLGQRLPLCAQSGKESREK